MNERASPFLPEAFTPVRGVDSNERVANQKKTDEEPAGTVEPPSPVQAKSHDTTLLGLFSRVSQQGPSNVKVRALLASIRDYTEMTTYLLLREPENEQRRDEVREQIVERCTAVSVEFLDAAKASGEEVAPWNYNFLTRQLTGRAAEAYWKTGAVPSPEAMRLALDTVFAVAEIQPSRVFADLPRTVEIRLSLMAHFVPNAGLVFEEIRDGAASPRVREMLFCGDIQKDPNAWEAGYGRAVAAAMDDLVRVSWNTASAICDHVGNSAERDRIIATKSIMASIATVQSMNLKRVYNGLMKDIREVWAAAPKERSGEAKKYFEKYSEFGPAPLQGLSGRSFSENCTRWWTSVSQQAELDVSVDMNESRGTSSLVQG
jgi:hypothetical protein